MAYSYYIAPPHPLYNHAFEKLGPVLQILKPFSKLKFTLQNAGECSSEFSSKQNIPGCMPLDPLPPLLNLPRSC